MIRLASLLLVSALSCATEMGYAQTATSYNDVLLMINDSSKNSVDIGNYFAQHRAIPARNVFHFQNDTSTSGDRGETIDSAAFKRKILWPLQTYMRMHNLVDSINYIVSTKGCPLRVTAPNAAGGFSALSSFTDCIALANAADSTFMLVNHNQGLVLSPYWTSSGMPVHFKHNQSTMPYYLTTRLDAYTVDQVKALIVRAEKPAYFGQGQYVLDIDPGRWGGGYAEGNLWLVGANDSLTALGLTTKLDTTNLYLTKQSNVIGYCSWGSNDGNAGTYSTHAIPQNIYLNGAIAETYVSTGGRSFNPGTDYGQSLIADLIAEGVTGVKGYTDEPYLSVMAEPHLLFTRMTEGFNLAESYWSSSPLMAWRQVVIGDPKMMLPRPMTANASSVSFGGIDRYASLSRSITLHNVSDITIDVKPLRLTGGDSTLFTVTTVGTLPRTLASHDSITFTANFRATNYQNFTTTARFPYRLNGNTGDQFVDVSLDGTGIRPKLSVMDTAHFANAAVGDSSIVSLSITNLSATDTLILSSMTFTGSGDFRLRGTIPTPVSPTFIPGGGSQNFPVAFTPRDSGTKQATLAIRSNATIQIKPTQVVMIGRGTVPSAVEEHPAVPIDLVLSDAFPNPFTGATMFSVHIPSFEGATLKVYDVLGRLVKDLSAEMRADGSVIRFDGSSLSNGVYRCRLTAGTSIVERSVVRSR